MCSLSVGEGPGVEGCLSGQGGSAEPVKSVQCADPALLLEGALAVLGMADTAAITDGHDKKQ